MSIEFEGSCTTVGKQAASSRAFPTGLVPVVKHFQLHNCAWKKWGMCVDIGAEIAPKWGVSPRGGFERDFMYVNRLEDRICSIKAKVKGIGSGKSD